MLGFGKGKIEIQINKYQYSPGETIQGNIALTLKKALTGKELSIRILGEQKISQVYGARRSYRIVKIFDFKQPLQVQKDYIANQQLIFPFKIKIPLNINSQTQMEGKLGTVLKVAQTFSGTRTRTKWYLIARLSVKGFDITKKVQITVT
ncbi:MAG: hypothetical protein ABIB47_04855 [Candidatus Woesearchaeota archaeon]